MIRVSVTSYWMPILSGILLSLTLPYFGLWPLVWVALVPLFLFVTHNSMSRVRLVGGTMLFGIIYAIAVIYPLSRITGWWWSGSSLAFNETGRYVIFALSVGVVGLWGSVFFIPLAFLVRKIHAYPYGGIVIALAWILVEWLRSSFALFGYSWGVLGYTLVDTQYIKHIASIAFPYELGGVYTLSFLLVLSNLFFTQLFSLPIGTDAKHFRNYSRRVFEFLLHDRRRFSSWFFVALFVCSLLFGIIKEHIKTHGEQLHVAVIASQISTEKSIGESGYRSYRIKIEDAFAQHAELVVLPENVFPFFEINETDGTLNKNSLVQFPDRDQLYADFVALLAAHPTTTVAVGLHTFDENRQRFNSVVFYEKGIPVAYYHKRKLVPFAEYAPLPSLFSLSLIFTPGVNKQYIAIAGIPASGLLCSEVGDATIPLARARLIVSPSNDSVFLSSSAGLMHHQMAKMRALENNAYLLRASKGGISSIIDPYGEVITSGSDGVLVADIFP